MTLKDQLVSAFREQKKAEQSEVQTRSHKYAQFRIDVVALVLKRIMEYPSLCNYKIEEDGDNLLLARSILVEQGNPNEFDVFNYLIDKADYTELVYISKELAEKTGWESTSVEIEFPNDYQAVVKVAFQGKI